MAEPTAQTVEDICPYLGLHRFDEEHAAFFCGRSAFSERLLAKVLEKDLVAVVGPSESGKSSVVRAGLLPLLRRQRPPANTWDVVVFKPGDRPERRLARALLRLLQPDLEPSRLPGEAEALGDRLAAGTGVLEDCVEQILDQSNGTNRLLLVADQFEELFTQTPAAVRGPFVEALLQARDRAPMTLLPTLRADYYDQALSRSRDLSDLVEGGLVNLGPMTEEEMRQAIEEPARRANLGFESGLVAISGFAN